MKKLSIFFILLFSFSYYPSAHATKDGHLYIINGNKVCPSGCGEIYGESCNCDSNTNQT